MNFQTRENIIQICRVLAEQQNLKATIKGSAKGALFAGIGVFVGGILAGPIGMAVGGTVTSIAVALSAQGEFKSVLEIINEMNENQRERLSRSVQRALQNVRPEDWMGLVSLALTSTSVKDVVLVELGNFLKHEFQMDMIRS